MAKSVLILSNKSSGSSAVQRLLAQAVEMKCVEKTRHFENESLYWTKAASVLDLPQQDMLDSEVPISQTAAREDLITLLRENLSSYSQPADDRTLVFDGWRQLCEQYKPIFLEKSPHHLLQWSALSLMVECIEQLDNEVDFLLVGLVRNPMDTLYSAFRRWKTPPEALQYEWLVAYQNLRKLSDHLGEYSVENPSGKVVVVRYEDLATSLAPLAPIFNFCGSVPSSQAQCLNRKSLLKWQQDSLFGFSLAPEVAALAMDYGYSDDELKNASSGLWPLYRDVLRGTYMRSRWIKSAYSRVRRSLTKVAR